MLSKEEPVSGDLEETVGCGVPPQRKKSFSPKRNHTVTLKSQETGGSPQEKEELVFPGRIHSAVDLKRLL